MWLRVLQVRSSRDVQALSARIGADADAALGGWAAVLEGEALLPAGELRGGARVLQGARGCALAGTLAALREGSSDPTLSPAVSAALLRAVTALAEPVPPWRVGSHLFEGPRPRVMGVVNVTPDSFSDGGRFFDPAEAVAHGCRLVEDGADLLDVGGESTRPRGAAYGAGAVTVDVDEEIRRVVPVIRGLRERCDVPLSVDTRKAEVAEAALDAGATVVNDVTGLVHDPRVAEVAAARGATLVLSHVPADIEALAHERPSDDVLGEVLSGLTRSLGRAKGAGVAPERLVVDPGLGFGKTPEGNLLLLDHLEALVALGFPVLVGASRKATFARLAAGPNAAAPLPMEERLGASLAAACAAAMRGARILRVHDVRETVRALRVVAAITGGPELAR